MITAARGVRPPSAVVAGAFWSPEAILEQGRSAALVAEKLLSIGGWRKQDMTEWITVVRGATALSDFLPVLEKWKLRAGRGDREEAGAPMVDAVGEGRGVAPPRQLQQPWA